MVNYKGIPHLHGRAGTPDDIYRSRLTPNEKRQCKTTKEKKGTKHLFNWKQNRNKSYFGSQSLTMS